MTFIPLTHTLDVYQPGAPVVDRFGNQRPGKGEWKKVQVASWWTDRTDEKAGESVLRTIDMLHIHAPAGAPFAPAGKVRLPDGGEWEITGNPEDYRHGFHGWDPGLIVIHCKKVEG